MWIEAVLSKEELSTLAGQLAPVTIRLGEDGELHVQDPTDIAVVPGLGLRLVCKARLRWTVLGIAVPLTLNSLVVLVRPAIAERAGVDVLVFRLEVEHADFAGLPTGVDNRVTDLVNRELEAKHAELSWNYAALLNHVFDLPGTLQPPERLKLSVRGARVKVAGDTLALAIDVHAEVLAERAGTE
jgi:hypothetical protein